MGILSTIAIDYDQAARDLGKLMARVADDREIVIIDRPGSEGVALVAVDELSGLLETAHLLSSPRNAERLLAALERARSQVIPPQSFEELHEAGVLAGKAKR